MIRWCRFNAVGLIGVLVQLAALHVLVAATGIPYLAATAVAVELAVLHNFVWHERWTWRERADGESRWARLAAFHAGNGLTSLVGNVILMRIFAGTLGMPILAANLVAIVICSTVNFFISDTIVYPERAAVESADDHRGR
jgi:putative flippase GtrA